MIYLLILICLVDWLFASFNLIIMLASVYYLSFAWNINKGTEQNSINLECELYVKERE